MPASATTKSNAVKKTTRPQAVGESNPVDVAFSVPENEHAWGISLLQSTSAIVITYINRHGIPYEDLEDLIDTVKGALSK